MNKLLTSLGTVCRWLWKVLTTGLSLLSSLFFLAFILVLFFLLYQPAVVVPEGAALIIAPEGDIVEETTAIDPLSRLINGYAGFPISKETLLQDILDAINAAADDRRIKILVLSLSHLEYSGLDQLQAIGRTIESFRKSGKKVIAIDDEYNQGQYYLASFADEVLLNPMGGVHLRGFGVSAST